MRPSLTTLGKTPLLPILAVVVSFFLVAGQVFNCCRLNESLSANVAKALERIGPWSNQSSGDSEVKGLKTHSGCHGHPVSSEPEATSSTLQDAPLRWLSAEACLSELDAAPEALEPPSNTFLDPFLATSLVIVDDLSISITRLEKPRPQNKSSPPVYLLTLRILV